MGIKNLHTTIDYKKLIEQQANTVVERNNQFSSKKALTNTTKAMKKCKTRNTHLSRKG